MVTSYLLWRRMYSETAPLAYIRSGVRNDSAFECKLVRVKVAPNKQVYSCLLGHDFERLGLPESTSSSLFNRR